MLTPHIPKLRVAAGVSFLGQYIGRNRRSTGAPPRKVVVDNGRFGLMHLMLLDARDLSLLNSEALTDRWEAKRGQRK